MQQPATPPRTISTLLALRMLTGSNKAQVGWLILAFGSLMFWALVWHADLTGWHFRRGRTVRTQGESLFCVQTTYSGGGSRTRRGTPVFENHYRYTVDGQQFESASYATGNCRAGGAVAVEYLRSEPGYSRIVGMRRRPLNGWTALLLIIPTVGAAFILVALRTGRRHLRLLANGLLTPARLADTAATNIRSSGRTVYRLTFEFTTIDGRAGCTSLLSSEPGRFGRGKEEALLYDPSQPANAALICSLPGKIAIDESGQPVARASLAFLLLPGIIVLGNIWHVLHLISPVY